MPPDTGFPFPLILFGLVSVEAELKRDAEVAVGRVADAGRDVRGFGQPESVVPVDFDVLDEGDDAEAELVGLVGAAERRVVEQRARVLAPQQDVVSLS